MTTEKEDWEHLVKHPGWLRLTAYAQKHWRDELASLMARAVDDRDDATALNKMRQVIAAQRAVEALIAHPAERLQKLVTPIGPDAYQEFARGGYVA